MLFLCYLILSVLQATAAPLSFVEMAKSNPHAFIDLLDSASPKAVDEIVALLQGMIGEANSKITKAERALVKAKKDYEDGKLGTGNQTEECERLDGIVKSVTKKCGELEGEFLKCQETKNERVPKLIKELAALNHVLGKIKTLQNSPENKSRRLLALNAEVTLEAIKEDPQSLLETLADANPKKVQQVIELIELLISEASAEKADIIRTCDAAKEASKACESHLHEVTSKSNICKATLAGKEDDVEKLKAALDAAQKFRDKWVPQYAAEIDTLKEIIRLLITTKDE